MLSNPIFIIVCKIEFKLNKNKTEIIIIFHNYLKDGSLNMSENNNPEIKENKSNLKPGKKKLSKGMKIAIAAIASVITIGAGIGIALGIGNNSTKNNENTPNTNNNGESGVVTPETEKTQEQLIESLEIPSGLRTEALADILIEDRFAQWLNSGVYTKNDAVKFKSNWINYNGTATDFTKGVAADNSVIFSSVLYLPGEKSTNLSNDIKKQTELNAGVLLNYAITAWNSDEHPENKEAFKVWFEVNSVTETSINNNERTLVIKYTQYSNADKNSIDPIVNPNGICTVTFRIIDGTEKITQISWVADKK